MHRPASQDGKIGLDRQPFGWAQIASGQSQARYRFSIGPFFRESRRKRQDSSALALGQPLQQDFLTICEPKPVAMSPHFTTPLGKDNVFYNPYSQMLL